MFSSLICMPTVEIPIFTQISGPEVKTLQPEVTTFWGLLGSFCEKYVFPNLRACRNIQ